jgi:arylsulfate sulfotransferase
VIKSIGIILRTLPLLGFAFLSASALRASISVTLSPSPAGPQPVGTVITWTATVEDTAEGAHEYQFSVGPKGGALGVVKDFTSSNTFQWAAGECGVGGVFTFTEGRYEVKVIVKNISNKTKSGPTAKALTVTTRLQSGLDAVTPTAHPLVALFSAQTCVTGNLIRVRFNQMGSTVSQTTNAIPCSPTNSANFYIAGMYPNMTYQMHHETLTSGGAILHTGSTLTFNTGSLQTTPAFPTNTVPISAVPPSSTSAPILLHDYILGAVPTATDLSGNVLWYYHLQVGDLTRAEPGGRFLIIDSPKGGAYNTYNEIVREIDLAGNITLETNTQRINDQLALMTGPNGQPRRPITGFDHEARRLSSGDIVVKAASEMLVTNAGQCGTTSGVANTCDVIGTQVLVLNPSLQIVWAWDAFDFLDISRRASLNEVCTQTDAGCPSFFLAATANDWLHTNSVQLTPDGNLLVSLRDQDWVIKINYANGTGDGSVLWRMGYQGDFTINNPPTPPAGSACTTPAQLQEYAWFTHQHDANFQFGAESVFTVFDNGNLRRRCDKNGNSRGYALTVDETTMTVTPLLVQDLGGYSAGLGSAQVIPGSSNYEFCNGEIVGPASSSLEITPSGTTAFEMDSANIWSYRTFRMQDLYTPAQPQ